MLELIDAISKKLVQNHYFIVAKPKPDDHIHTLLPIFPSVTLHFRNKHLNDIILTQPKLVSTYFLPEIIELLCATVNDKLMCMIIVPFPSVQRQKQPFNPLEKLN